MSLLLVFLLVYFNSIKVRLEHAYQQQQSINSTDFNSIKVRLEQESAASVVSDKAYFNSIKVRLEPPYYDQMARR